MIQSLEVEICSAGPGRKYWKEKVTTPVSLFLEGSSEKVHKIKKAILAMERKQHYKER
jgi:hypothetical protein